MSISIPGDKTFGEWITSDDTVALIAGSIIGSGTSVLVYTLLRELNSTARPDAIYFAVVAWIIIVLITYIYVSTARDFNSLAQKIAKGSIRI